METPKNEPWNFCETPKEKCTMNYCDDNGCQNRKRNLVEPKKSKAATFILGQIDKAIEKSNLEQQIEKTETLYRKVAVSEKKPQSSGFYWIENIVGEMKSSYYDSLLKMFTGDYANFWLKPLPDNEESLLKQNAELLEALENLTEYGSTGEDAVEMKREIESLIQKMKKCQENTSR